MAVKASAHITLHSVVDIQATYRYYLLQSSTLSKPAVPTTNPPSSAWDDSEPTYTSGSTNSLYYVDLTVYSNGTYQYSEVSLSTAYEAAKEAYNKAENAQGTANGAQEDIDNLEIGGRNLLRYTNVGLHYDKWLAWNSATITVTDDGYMKVTPANADSTSMGVYPPMTGKLENGTEYTLSFVAYADANMKLNYNYIMCAASSNTSLADMNIAITTTPGKYTYTFTTSADYSECSIMIGAYYSNNTIGPYYIRDIKLEKGNRATDWTASPEDVDEDIETSKELAESNKITLNNAILDIDAIKGMLSTLVIDENGNSLMTQNGSGWSFNLGAVQNSLDKVKSDVTTINNGLTYTNDQITGLKQIVSDLSEYTDYITFDTYEDKPCITLGETDSEYKAMLTNLGIMFKEGTSTPASISDGALKAEKVIVTEELSQGDFSWVTRSNGNYGLIWKGE